MQRIQTKHATCNVEEITGPGDLIRLWFATEEMRGVCADDFEEDCRLEPFRDKLSTQQISLAHSIIKMRVTKLQHVLDKLSMWKSAYGPGIDETLESTGDIYTFMAMSAMEDLRALIGREVLS